jgi:hypothetical protein
MGHFEARSSNIMNTLVKRSIYLSIYYIYLINIFNITTVEAQR